MTVTTLAHPIPAVETYHSADGVLVKVTGRIDVHSVADLRRRLHPIIDDTPGPLLLDLGDAVIADGTALGLLLECHRRGLRRLVSIDLKLREFKPGDKGQMERGAAWSSSPSTTAASPSFTMRQHTAAVW